MKTLWDLIKYQKILNRVYMACNQTSAYRIMQEILLSRDDIINKIKLVSAVRISNIDSENITFETANGRIYIGMLENVTPEEKALLKQVELMHPEIMFDLLRRKVELIFIVGPRK